MNKAILGVLVLHSLIGCAGLESPSPSGQVEPQAAPIPDCSAGCTRKQPNCEGWVRFSFDISGFGTVKNARVLSACPAGKFDKAAFIALSTWRYSAMNADRKNLQVQLDFPLD